MPVCSTLLPRRPEGRRTCSHPSTSTCWVTHDRAAMLDPAFANQVNAGGRPSPALIVDGEVVGIWSRSERKSEPAIAIEPFRELGPGDRDAIAR